MMQAQGKSCEIMAPKIPDPSLFAFLVNSKEIPKKKQGVSLAPNFRGSLEKKGTSQKEKTRKSKTKKQREIRDV